MLRDYQVKGTKEISLHHIYRSMAFLGDIRKSIEEQLFFRNRNLFSALSVVFFDTTSLYFEGAGGSNLGRHGYSKDRRPDENQMIVGAVLDEAGCPIASPMWPGNTPDAKTLKKVVSTLKDRFGVGSLTIVADRGMVSVKNIKMLEDKGLTYILGVKMRLEKKAMRKVLSRGGRFKEVNNNLMVKEVFYEKKRYIVCINPLERKKDAADRDAIICALKDKLKSGASKLIGNSGYKRYLKIDKGSVRIDEDKIKEEKAYDGKWVLITNTDMSASDVALRYKELFQVEAIFRETKSVLKTRPIYHHNDLSIMGHVFVSFLALVIMKELKTRLGNCLEWDEIRQDLDSLYKVEIAQDKKTYSLRSPLQGVASNVFKAVGVAIPPTVIES